MFVFKLFLKRMVFCGRPSSKRFASSIQDGVEAFDEQVFQAGKVVTAVINKEVFLMFMSCQVV